MKLIKYLALIGLFSANVVAQTWQVPEQYQELNEVLESRELASSKAILEKLSYKPSAGVDYYFKGRVEQLSGSLDNAAEHYKKAIELEPENYEFHYRFGSTSLLLASTESFFYVPFHALNAKSSLEKAHQINPSHLDSIKWLIRYHIFVPSIAGGSIETALKLVEKMKPLNQVDAMIFELRLHRQNDDLEQIHRCAQVVREELPGSARALTAVGFAFQYQEQYEQAFEFFELATQQKGENKQDVSSKQALYQLGKTAVLWEKSLEQGAMALKQYANLDLNHKLPSVPWSQYRLAQIMLLQGKVEQARKYADLATQSANEDELNKRLKVLAKRIKRKS